MTDLRNRTSTPISPIKSPRKRRLEEPQGWIKQYTKRRVTSLDSTILQVRRLLHQLEDEWRDLTRTVKDKL